MYKSTVCSSGSQWMWSQYRQNRHHEEQEKGVLDLDKGNLGLGEVELSESKDGIK